MFRVPNAVEDLADGQRCRRVAADEPEAILQLGRNWILQPEEMIGLQLLAQAGCLYGSEPVVNIVQQIQIVTQRFAQRLKELGNMAQILFRGPQALGRQTTLGRLVVLVIFCHAIG